VIVAERGEDYSTGLRPVSEIEELRGLVEHYALGSLYMDRAGGEPESRISNGTDAQVPALEAPRPSIMEFFRLDIVTGDARLSSAKSVSLDNGSGELRVSSNFASQSNSARSLQRSECFGWSGVATLFHPLMKRSMAYLLASFPGAPQFLRAGGSMTLRGREESK